MASRNLETAYTRMMVEWGHHLGDGNRKGCTFQSAQQSWWHTTRLRTGQGGYPIGQQPYYHQIPGYI